MEKKLRWAKGNGAGRGNLFRVITDKGSDLNP